MSRFITLIIFIVVVVGVGSLTGATFTPGAWFENLNAPFFNPPGYLFGIVWPILYVLIAIAGWRVFISAGKNPGWGLWCAQMVLNWAWSPVFFGAHQLFWGIWIIVATLACTLAFISTVKDKDALAAYCMMPYAAWLTFALLLNVSFWYLN